MIVYIIISNIYFPIRLQISMGQRMMNTVSHGTAGMALENTSMGYYVFYYVDFGGWFHGIIYLLL